MLVQPRIVFHGCSTGLGSFFLARWYLTLCPCSFGDPGPFWWFSRSLRARVRGNPLSFPALLPRGQCFGRAGQRLFLASVFGDGLSVVAVAGEVAADYCERECCGMGHCFRRVLACGDGSEDGSGDGALRFGVWVHGCWSRAYVRGVFGGLPTVCACGQPCSVVPVCRRPVVSLALRARPLRGNRAP